MRLENLILPYCIVPHLIVRRYLSRIYCIGNALTYILYDNSTRMRWLCEIASIINRRAESRMFGLKRKRKVIIFP